MRLWTYHPTEFSPVIGPVNPALSKFALKFPDAYKRLWSDVGTDQFIWCATNPVDWALREEWILEAPVYSFLKIIDSMVWEGVIGTKGCPPKLHDQMLEESMGRFDDADEAYAHVEERKIQLWYPSGDPWKSLFLDDPTDLRANILLPCPINPAWQIRDGRYNSSGSSMS